MRQQRERGFTIIELIIALFVFVVAGGGIAGANLYCHRLSEDVTNAMRAVDDLDDMMEHVQATPFSSLQVLFPGGVVNGGGGNAYAAVVGGYTLDGEQIIVTYPSQTAGRLEMLVTVNWLQRGRSRSARTATIRTNG